MLGLIFLIMLAVLGIVYLVVSGQDIPGRAMTVAGASSIFPAGDPSRVTDARNGWQGYAFAGNFRFFSRPSAQAREDFQKLARENFGRAALRQDLALFAGGVYVLQKAGKGYRLFCIFAKGGVNYWADMRSRDSLHFSRQAFERFILNLEIEGEKTAPIVAGQIAAFHGKISPFILQTPGQLLGFMAAIFTLVLVFVTALVRFSGSCPRGANRDGEGCTPGATLAIREYGRRQVTACCLCREGEFLVIYRFRRPYLRIDIRGERRDIVWEKRSFRYKNIRVTLGDDDFQNWRLRLMA